MTNKIVVNLEKTEMLLSELLRDKHINKNHINMIQSELQRELQKAYDMGVLHREEEIEAKDKRIEFLIGMIKKYEKLAQNMLNYF